MAILAYTLRKARTAGAYHRYIGSPIRRLLPRGDDRLINCDKTDASKPTASARDASLSHCSIARQKMCLIIACIVNDGKS